MQSNTTKNRQQDCRKLILKLGLFCGSGPASGQNLIRWTLHSTARAWHSDAVRGRSWQGSIAAEAATVGSIDAVQLEDTLGEVQTDCGNLHGGRLLQLDALCADQDR